MNITLILVLILLLLGINFLILFYVVTKVKSMSKFIYKNDLDNIPIIIDQLKELIIESERVSEKLDSAINEKEQLLEDINALVEDKLNRLHNIINSDTKEKNIRERIKELHLQGLTPAEIAKKLEISVTEVNLVIKIL